MAASLHTRTRLIRFACTSRRLLWDRNPYPLRPESRRLSFSPSVPPSPLLLHGPSRRRDAARERAENAERRAEKLNSERALAVEDYLASKGLDKDRMYISGYGPAKPRSSKKDSRRVEIVIMGG